MKESVRIKVHSNFVSIYLQPECLDNDPGVDDRLDLILSHTEAKDLLDALREAEKELL